MNVIWDMYKSFEQMLERFCEQTCSCGAWQCRRTIDPREHSEESDFGECPYRNAFSAFHKR